MDTVDIISSYCLVKNSVFQGPSFSSYHQPCQYLRAAQHCNGDQAISSMLPHSILPQGTEKVKTREANDVLPASATALCQDH